jgi:16S rRNA (uracil1498-N3)-methyltransferase
MPRLYFPGPLAAGLLDLPRDLVRHVQALRLRPGDALTLFDGLGGEWQGRLVSPAPAASVELMRHLAVERELPWEVTLAVGMPANERMDWLMEKATELGAARVQPLMTSRTVLRLDGERALRRTAHWQAVVQAACEQCGRNLLPQVAVAARLEAWLAALPSGTGTGVAARCMLAAPGEGQALPFAAWAGRLVAAPEKRAGPSQGFLTPSGGLAQSDGSGGAPEKRAGPWGAHAIVVLSGPEGGLSPDESALAQRAGFVAVSLGPRVLRAETAPLALLAALAATPRPEQSASAPPD